MKSYRTDGSGRPDGITLADVAIPRPGPGEIAVRMRAVSLNYLDLKVIAGTFPGGRSGLVPLSDGAGEVLEVGPAVSAWTTGDRVVTTFFPRWQAGPISDGARSVIPGSTVDGMLQEVVILREDAVVAAPAHLDWGQAACLPCAGLTGWQVLTGARPVLPGEVVLVQGTGGVSLFALQFARAAGARVIATSSSPAKAERLRAMGAETVIDYRQTPDWGDAVKRATAGQGADHIIEIGEAGTLEQSIRAAAIGAQINLIGRPVDAPKVDPAILMLAMGATYRRIAVGSRADFEAMNKALSALRIEPVIDRRFGPDAISEALRYGAGRGQFGKIVIHLDEDV
ncbi:zinc-dependent alcohol dehydrogenase family protein [Pararhodobacter aggregans]|uniref:NAD(P)-dependent alcohol dehydrogenase n=1 Tax=Pararhodobacter aggregans TaxID=404875 RepID=A0A2T7UMS3_9RHOB|nr:NAD(P)-dependent alcohol dehydrogenase [Pararhodobacter aggregans]PTW99443.1 NADPH:quinone reductase-like Zn-dependent oxidoreductase [Pararhodobacter aggregans]PVE45977.1 NAD(P)-dependent alcohol dehydrogenase [Pararhodobacter aggregans]